MLETLPSASVCSHDLGDWPLTVVQMVSKLLRVFVFGLLISTNCAVSVPSQKVLSLPFKLKSESQELNHGVLHRFTPADEDTFHQILNLAQVNMSFICYTHWFT